ncbi:Planctomycete cytochrome C [Stieleria varia]|uniref:Planctomycete cytochrome C n=2 Tax=Stieleria varia TaxID=2528005 RepID=A0A5C6AUL5_9BACT|nr:Planctomycete cytochrome C [Stieleria varia]
MLPRCCRVTRLTFSSTLLFTLVLSSTELTNAAEPTIRFNRDIRAVLTDKCFACHGPDAETVEGGLRLDLRDQAIEAKAFTPHNSGESELIRRIESDDADEVMPPPESHKSLTDEEKSLLKRWIDEGATYEPHWAYTPMQLTPMLSEHQGNPTAMIDAAVQQELTASGIAPAPIADRITLIRRLSFDLTGMPPTPEEVDAFINDSSEGAYHRVVDRLLGSARFGERMAIYWLDLVRYADTVGYHGDQNVSQSPYRDYVINAFNENMPYDQFVREQLAGDLLPDATLQQRVASGYNRLNQTTEEGGSQAKEYLAIYFADRVRNVSQVFMGATVGCAQCHDHKYDPYTSKDFYSLGAFFADLEERGVYGARERPPMIRVPSDEQQQQLYALDRQIAELQADEPKVREQALAKLADWETLTRQKMVESKEVDMPWVDDAQETGGKSNGDWKFVSGKKVPVHSGKSSRRQESGGLVQHFFEGANPTTKVEPNTRFYAWVHLDPKNPPKALMIQLNDGSWDHRYVWGSDDIEYGRRPESWDGYHRAGPLPELGKWVRLEVDPAEIGLPAGKEINGMAFTQFGGLVHWDQAGWVSSTGLPQNIAETLAVAPSDRKPERTAELHQYYLDHAEPMVAYRKQLAALQADRKSVEESAPLTVVSKSVEPRTIRILPRGNWLDDSGAVVEPAIPAFLGDLNVDGRRATRLDLADWLCRSDNPLTARTMTNRMWSLLFGRGLCTSVDDLGGQGTYPSYPDLLDALSIEFVQSGWDIKALMRWIVMSETYRRSSTPTPELKNVDPYNDLFARQGRFCIDAEMVRDAALATSGLLTESVGGPSTHPYQPAGYYAQLNFPRRTYQADDGADQYRRGVYTHWQRTFLHPMLKAFDAPSREECTAARARSNTPLQALVLLNDPTFVEAARVFAARIMREGGSDVPAKIQWAYTTAVSRGPDELISDELQKLFNEHLKEYQADIEAAKKLIATGDAVVETQLDPAELAAWTGVARVLLNLHETITRY